MKPRKPLSIALREEERELVEAGAEAAGERLTAFIRQAALIAAAKALRGRASANGLTRAIRARLPH